MKIKAGLIAMVLILSLLAVPSVFAQDESTDPDLSNNEASVTVTPTADETPDDTTDNNPPETNQPETIPMLPTGTPLAGILAAISMVLAGFLAPVAMKK